MRFILASILLAFLASCSHQSESYDFDLQGHRGARGLFPENTIPGFLAAAGLGVDTIEMDLVVTADGKLIVSHEPWFHYLISTKPDGNPVTREEQMSLNIYEMTAEEVFQYDVGARGHENFPNQQPIRANKPLFLDAIRAIEAYSIEQEISPFTYNIETKSNPEQYGVYYPRPEEFASILYEDLKVLHNEFDLFPRVTIQSFDPATLIALRELNPTVSQAILVSRDEPIQASIDRLGYTPEIFSPNYQLVTKELVEEAHNNNMKIIPWTVNTINEMRVLLQMNVDGLITDYPDSAAILR